MDVLHDNKSSPKNQGALCNSFPDLINTKETAEIRPPTNFSSKNCQTPSLLLQCFLTRKFFNVATKGVLRFSYMNSRKELLFNEPFK